MGDLIDKIAGYLMVFWMMLGGFVAGAALYASVQAIRLSCT